MALIAQLGERQTEDLKVLCSIHSQGNSLYSFLDCFVVFVVAIEMLSKKNRGRKNHVRRLWYIFYTHANLVFFTSSNGLSFVLELKYEVIFSFRTRFASKSHVVAICLLVAYVDVLMMEWR